MTVPVDFAIRGPRFMKTLFLAGKGPAWLGAEDIGPILLAPGEAASPALRLQLPTLQELENGGTLPPPPSSISLGILVSMLDPDPDGQVIETIYPVTSLDRPSREIESSTAWRMLANSMGLY